MPETFETLSVAVDNHVGLIEIRKPPHNFFDYEMIADIATALEALDRDPACRSVVLAAEGRSFCAGADHSKRSEPGQPGGSYGRYGRHLYKEAIRMFRTRKPIVAAVHGAAIGGGLGLACAADFRVTCPEARFSANFTRLGFHPGFGLTELLPRLVGQQAAALLFYTGRRIGGEEATRLGLADLLVPQEEVRGAALALATEIAGSAPLAVQSTRHTLRRGLADAFEVATEREHVEQDWLRRTDDYAEGVAAGKARRDPDFSGR